MTTSRSSRRPQTACGSTLGAVPVGTPVRFEPDVRQLGDRALFGGTPARVVRLTDGGRRACAELRRGTVQTAAGARLARRLLDGGLLRAEPRPAVAVDVTIVVPVRDRADQLAGLLARLGTRHPVLVVDDGSRRPDELAAACARHGARLVRRDVNGGPAAARNAALPHVDTALIAFCDSDCRPPDGWIDQLAGHFDDPAVGAVAPRVVGRSRGRAVRSPLDLGPRAAPVRPKSRVSYLPTAALIVRRAAIGAGFDEQLRYGEDVDLIWRLDAAGWRCRFDPRVSVAHEEPAGEPLRLRRRFAYGTSAAPLARRHPGALAPLVLHPWPTVAVAALLARRPLLALTAWAAGALLLARRLRRAGVPAAGSAAATAQAVAQTGLGVGRWGVQFAGPLLLAGLGTRRRDACAALLLAPALAAARRAPDHRVAAGVHELLDQAAYGAGVWAGALRARDSAAVLPVLGGDPLAPVLRLIRG